MAPAKHPACSVETMFAWRFARSTALSASSRPKRERNVGSTTTPEMMDESMPNNMAPHPACDRVSDGCWNVKVLETTYRHS